MLHNIASPSPSRLTLTVKYGGNAMGPERDDALIAEVAELRCAGHAIILVHGGGPEIDEALKQQGLVTERIDGLRATDAQALDVVEAVLCATANKRLVRACLRYGIPAVGISGQDGALVKVRRAVSPSGFDLGFVGEIVSVDPGPLFALLRAGYTPIISPIAIDEGAEHAYNVNADTVAGAIAAAVSADAYVALTNVERVLRDPKDPSSAVEHFSIAEALHFVASDACLSSMKPKIRAAIDAVAGGVLSAYICGAKPGAITAALHGCATVIERR